MKKIVEMYAMKEIDKMYVMDEIDELNKLIKKLKYTWLITLGIHFWYFYIVMSIGGVFKELDQKDTLFYILNTSVLYVIMAIIISSPIWITIIIKHFRYKNKKVFDKTSIKNIIREISEEYSPAICSFLYNGKIETYTDFTATVLNLEQKGFIKFNCKNDNYSLDFIDEENKRANVHEKYVLECLKGKKLYMPEFEYCVTNDMKDLGLIETKKKSTNSETKEIILIHIIAICAMFLFGVLNFFAQGYDINKTTRYISILSIIIIISITTYFLAIKKKKYKILLTKKGKEIKKQVNGFKAFFDQYTLMNDRNINYKELLGNYVAYAISLGETDLINKFIEQNEQYRNFIYRTKREVKDGRH